MTNTERKAIVLAAGGGLGSATAVRLARDGFEIVACDLNEAAVQRTSKAVRAAGGVCHPRVVDLADVERVREDTQDTADTLGTSSVIVTIPARPCPALTVGIPLAVRPPPFDAMFLSIVHATESVLPAVRAPKWGRIISRAPSGVVTPIPILLVYTAVRSTVLGWS